MIVKGSYEDIIYIVIGILWIAYSIYKGTQKAKSKGKTAEPVESEEPKKSVFESFLDDIIVEEGQDPYAPQPDVIEEQVVEKKKEKVFSYDDYYEEGKYRERVADKDIKIEPTIKFERDKKLDPSKRKKPRFNLRKAVVYSEILNRRYT